jgi:hypothetical protein
MTDRKQLQDELELAQFRLRYSKTPEELGEHWDTVQMLRRQLRALEEQSQGTA